LLVDNQNRIAYTQNEGVMMMDKKFCLSVILFFVFFLTGCLIIPVGNDDSTAGIEEADYETDKEDSEIEEIEVIYKEIDEHALNTPNSVEKDINSLISYLIEPARSEEERARAIYRWITGNIEYDADSFFSGNYPDTSPEAVLRSRMSVCDGFANLFLILAEKAGLDVVKINGYAKGIGYTVGDNFTGETNHAWNAVFIKGKWRLIDCTWGAGYLNINGQFEKQFQEHYFFTTPENFIFDHFPQDPFWQLLEKPLSLREFESLVKIDPAFFKCGLSVINNREGKIYMTDTVTITLKSSLDVSIIGILYQNNQEVKKDVKVSAKEGGFFDITVSGLDTGEYLLMIFVKPGKGMAGQYESAIYYKIIVK
jgi:transglutaminase/protease-like cytokinesis protein 3